MTSDDVTQAELVRWLKRVDGRLGGIEKNMAENFVTKELYLTNRDNDREEAKSTRNVAMWSLALVATLTLGTLFAVIGGV